MFCVMIRFAAVREELENRDCTGTRISAEILLENNTT